MPGNTLQWLGHSTFLLTTAAGYRILIDPWLQDNPARPRGDSGPRSVDLILLTHAHGDHMGDLLEIARRTAAPVLTIFDLAGWLHRKGVKDVIGMNKGGTVKVGPVRVTMVHAEHSATLQDGDTLLPGGEPVGYIVHLPDDTRVWHMGDTAVFGDMALIADIYHPDVILMPIGDHFVMSPLEASHACRLTKARKVVPMHFGTFPVLSGTPQELRRLTADLPDLEIVELKPGETLDV
jgi:L-ascorbate metabolism protein UlaG (beta-lactamase superfamily)